MATAMRRVWRAGKGKMTIIFGRHFRFLGIFLYFRKLVFPYSLLYNSEAAIILAAIILCIRAHEKTEVM